MRWDDYRSVLDLPMYTLNGATTQASHAEESITFTNYQAGLVYKPSVNSSVYVSYGTSSTLPGNAGGDGLNYVSRGYANINNTKHAPGCTRFDAMASCESTGTSACRCTCRTWATSCIRQGVVAALRRCRTGAQRHADGQLQVLTVAATKKAPR